MTDSARQRLAVASLVFALAAPLAYVTQRIYERARGAIVSPFLLVRDLHVGYFYRVAIAVFVGGAIAAIAQRVLEASDARPERVGRRLGLAAYLITAIVFFISLRFP